MLVVLKQKLTPYVAQMVGEAGAPRNAHPYSRQTVALKKNITTGKYITGYEQSFKEGWEEVLKAKKGPNYDIIKERVRIEQELGVSLDGMSSNEFLQKTRINLCVPNVAEIIMDLRRPLELFHYRALIANGIVAPDQASLNRVEYLNKTYYFTAPSQESDNKQFIAKVRNKIGGRLSDNEDNKLWLLSIAHLLNLPIGTDLSAKSLYVYIDDYKNKLNSMTEAKKVLAVIEKNSKDLMHGFIVNAAAKFGALQRDKNAVLFEGRMIGSTMDEAIANLQTVEYEEVFVAVKEKILRRYGIE
jgi:hypothetical protein